MTVRSRVRANEVRSTGPTFDHWPASLPQVAYVTDDGGFLCVTCANGGHGSLASTTSDDPQWRIIGAQINDTETPCAHCDRLIPMAVAVEFLPFDTWDQVLAHVANHYSVWYHAPLDVRPVRVSVTLRGAKLRVYPPSNDADPFTADASHLERFRRRVER